MRKLTGTSVIALLVASASSRVQAETTRDSQSPTISIGGNGIVSGILLRHGFERIKGQKLPIPPTPGRTGGPGRAVGPRPVAPRPTLPAGLTYPANPNLCGAWQPGFRPDTCQPGPIPPARPVPPNPGVPVFPGVIGGAVRTPVRDLLDLQQLPAASIAIPPGRAITGLRSYLTIGASEAETVAIFDGVDSVPVYCSTTAFHVDWGDGGATTTRSRGGPYPDGDVTHVYENVGRYDLGVVTDWHCTWAVAGAADEGDTTRPGAPLLDFTVDQVQAVVDG